MERIKELLNHESKYKLDPETMDKLLNMAVPVYFRRGQIVFDEGSVDKDIYILKEGIVAYTYMDGSNERCYAFALPATIIYSSASYLMNETSFYRVSACCDTVMLRISKQDFDLMIDSCPEFARFILGVTMNQLYLIERKNILINGNSAERFRMVIKNRPEIVRHVTSKLIASYLGITQQHLCRLKKKLLQ